ncbi:hypothetical protein ACH9L7_09865 [Haloferax sp. S1W]
MCEYINGRVFTVGKYIAFNHETTSEEDTEENST